MSTVPREPEAFTEHVARLFGRLVDRTSIEIVGPLEMRIDDHAVELDDIHKAALVLTDADACEPMIERFIDASLAAWRIERTPIPFEVARAKILPVIASLDQLSRHPEEHVAAQPFVNDTYILYVLDLSGASVPVTIEQLVRWGIEMEAIDTIARKNLAAFQPELELKLFNGDAGAAALFNVGDGYDASRLLLDQLHGQLAPELGGDFLVAIPTRDVFLAFPTGPDPFVDRLRERVLVDYKKLPYPITENLFLVTLDGVAPWSDAA